jgi:hypothetical protein
MSLDIRKLARDGFAGVLERRGKTIDAALLDRLEQAFRLPAIQQLVDGPSYGRPRPRHERTHRDQIGQLARSLGHMVATSSPQPRIDATHIRQGFALWRQTTAFRTVASRYHRSGPHAARPADVEAAIGIL